MARSAISDPCHWCAHTQQPVDITEGITDKQTERVAKALGFTGASQKDAQEQMKRLYKMFLATDSTQVEINPFVITKDGKSRHHLLPLSVFTLVCSHARFTVPLAVYCVDAKFNFDDNAQFRQQPIFALRDTSMEVGLVARASG